MPSAPFCQSMLARSILAQAPSWKERQFSKRNWNGIGLRAAPRIFLVLHPAAEIRCGSVRDLPKFRFACERSSAPSFLNGLLNRLLTNRLELFVLGRRKNRLHLRISLLMDGSELLHFLKA